MTTTQTYEIGDAFKLIKKLSTDTVDLITTDPPYGISFMNHKWDIDVPSVELWKECLRVLKPGAFAFVMSSPRQDVFSENIVRLRQAGFDTNFTSIYWTYASGFPKAMNIGKAIDKRLNLEREIIGQKKLNPRDKKVYTPNSYDGLQGSSILEKNPNMNMMTLPSSPEAKSLDGSYAGFQPKPAIEVIIVAMKSLSENTFVDQALKNRHGTTWLDDCRIPYNKDDLDITKHNFMSEREYVGNDWKTPEDTIYKMGIHQCASLLNKEGRFPANLLVSDNVLNNGCTRTSCKSSELHNEYGDKFKFGGVVSSPDNQYSDSSSYYRYFDIDKWFEEMIKKLPQEVQNTFPFLIVEKASKSEKNKGVPVVEKEIGHNRFDTCAICGGYILQNPDRPSACKCTNPLRKNNKILGNFHATVKPLKLFSYLITLGSRSGDTIVDPFLGSGTALRACRLLGRNFVGFEIDPQYEPIIKGRSMSEQPQIKDHSITNIFEA